MADTQVQSGGGHGGIYALLVVIVVLIVAAFLWFGGVFGGRGDDADMHMRIEAPEGLAPGGGS